MKTIKILLVVALLVAGAGAIAVGTQTAAQSSTVVPASQISIGGPTPAIQLACSFPPCDCSAGC